jgi:polyisoprenyl-teichoic acid--peptidoglycan teichoic acid transferase
MPRSHWGVAWRGMLALVVVVACAAGATATAGLLKVKDFVNVINTQRAIRSNEITLPQPGKPQTLLLVGVDHRYGEGSSPGNTDTMMLVRINDDSTTINTLSIPRDLQVNVPGYGLEKINAAYSEKGPTLLIKTLKEDVFPGLHVNHLLIVDFSSFANLINAIGCVYAQVDHRYYNHSEGPLDPTTDYSSIDIQPGYQKLCGGSGSSLGGAKTALAFVRFRHNDSDFVRQARQQAFLRWAKEGFSTSELLNNQTTLLNDFAHDVQMDAGLHSTSGVITLFNLAINANGSAQKSIPFPDGGSIGNTSNLAFNPTLVEQAYREFMRPTHAAPDAGSTTTQTTTTTTPVTTGRHRHSKKRIAVYTPPQGMVPDPADGISQAAHLGNTPLRIYYPKDIPDNFTYCFSVSGNCDIGYEVAANPEAYAASYPRYYKITGFGGKRYPSYVMTLVYSSGGQSDTATGEYATVQGTTWPGAGHAAGPPILRAGYVTKVVNHKLLYEYSQGGALAVVAWKTSHGVYWISNTLQNNIPNDQMIAMAASFTPAG